MNLQWIIHGLLIVQKAGKWRGTFQYFQSHDKIPYIYYLEKPVAVSEGALYNISSIQKKHEQNIK